MNIDRPDAIHLVAGSGAADALQAAMQLSQEQIIVHEDDLTSGPTPPTSDLGRWRFVREEFLKSIYWDLPVFSFSQYADTGLLSNFVRLADADRVFIWVAAGLHEHLMAAFAIRLLLQAEKDMSVVSIVPVELCLSGTRVRGLGELSVKNIGALNLVSMQLTQTSLDEYRQAWQAYTSSNPQELIDFLSCAHENKALVRAMNSLIQRYPSATSGLSKIEEQLLYWTREKGPAAARIVGAAIAWNDSLITHFDEYYFHLLRKLGDSRLASPLVSLSGDLAVMRACKVTLTNFGKQILSGSGNSLKVNGIDDWVGGCHLDGISVTPVRIGEDLVVV